MIDKIKKGDVEKIAYGVGGMALAAFAMKTIEKATGSPTVQGIMGLEGTATLKEVAPAIVTGVVGTALFAKNRTKPLGYAGVGMAMAAGAKVVDKFTEKSLFSGLGNTEQDMYYPEALQPGYEYVELPETAYNQPEYEEIEYMEGIEDGYESDSVDLL